MKPSLQKGGGAKRKEKQLSICAEPLLQVTGLKRTKRSKKTQETNQFEGFAFAKIQNKDKGSYAREGHEGDQGYVVPVAISASSKMSMSPVKKIENLPKNTMSKYYFNMAFNKTKLKQLVDWCLKTFGEHKTVLLVDSLKTLGYNYATKAGLSLGIEDLLVPTIKKDKLLQAQLKLSQSKLDIEMGHLNQIEYGAQLIATWNNTNEDIKNHVISNFRQKDTLNPVFMMAFSGARGNISQVRQLTGMRGLMSDPSGKIIDFPIESNFREGLTLTEYLISCYGARKGVVDTALRTATSGYLTRRLVDSAHHVIITADDCQASNGITLSYLGSPTASKKLLTLENRLIGRVLHEDIHHEGNGRLLATRNQEIDQPLAYKIAQMGKYCKVRSPLTCQQEQAICQKCYGWNLASRQIVSIGEAIGTIAAQSIGEPGTQLTMRTFHTGGVFSGRESSEFKSPLSGIVFFLKPVPGKCVRTAQGHVAFLTLQPCQLKIQQWKKDEAQTLQQEIETQQQIETQQKTEIISLDALTLLFVKHGQKISLNQVFAETCSSQQQNESEITIKSPVDGQIRFQPRQQINYLPSKVFFTPRPKRLNKKSSKNNFFSFGQGEHRSRSSVTPAPSPAPSPSASPSPPSEKQNSPFPWSLPLPLSLPSFEGKQKRKRLSAPGSYFDCQSDKTYDTITQIKTFNNFYFNPTFFYQNEKIKQFSLIYNKQAWRRKWCQRDRLPFSGASFERNRFWVLTGEKLNSSKPTFVKKNDFIFNQSPIAISRSVKRKSTSVSTSKDRLFYIRNFYYLRYKTILLTQQPVVGNKNKLFYFSCISARFQLNNQRWPFFPIVIPTGLRHKNFQRLLTSTHLFKLPPKFYSRRGSFLFANICMYRVNLNSRWTVSQTAQASTVLALLKSWTTIFNLVHFGIWQDSTVSMCTDSHVGTVVQPYLVKPSKLFLSGQKKRDSSVSGTQRQAESLSVHLLSLKSKKHLRTEQLYENSGFGPKWGLVAWIHSQKKVFQTLNITVTKAHNLKKFLPLFKILGMQTNLSYGKNTFFFNAFKNKPKQKFYLGLTSLYGIQKKVEPICFLKKPDISTVSLLQFSNQQNWQENKVFDHAMHWCFSKTYKDTFVFKKEVITSKYKPVSQTLQTQKQLLLKKIMFNFPLSAYFCFLTWEFFYLFVYFKTRHPLVATTTKQRCSHWKYKKLNTFFNYQNFKKIKPKNGQNKSFAIYYFQNSQCQNVNGNTKHFMCQWNRCHFVSLGLNNANHLNGSNLAWLPNQNIRKLATNLKKSKQSLTLKKSTSKAGVQITKKAATKRFKKKQKVSKLKWKTTAFSKQKSRNQAQLPFEITYTPLFRSKTSSTKLKFFSKIDKSITTDKVYQKKPVINKQYILKGWVSLQPEGIGHFWNHNQVKLLGNNSFSNTFLSLNSFLPLITNTKPYVFNFCCVSRSRGKGRGRGYAPPPAPIEKGKKFSNKLIFKQRAWQNIKSLSKYPKITDQTSTEFNVCGVVSAPYSVSHTLFSLLEKKNILPFRLKQAYLTLSSFEKKILKWKYFNLKQEKQKITTLKNFFNFCATEISILKTTMKYQTKSKKKCLNLFIRQCYFQTGGSVELPFFSYTQMSLCAHKFYYSQHVRYKLQYFENRFYYVIHQRAVNPDSYTCHNQIQNLMRPTAISERTTPGRFQLVHFDCKWKQSSWLWLPSFYRLHFSPVKMNVTKLSVMKHDILRFSRKALFSKVKHKIPFQALKPLTFSCFQSQTHFRKKNLNFFILLCFICKQNGSLQPYLQKWYKQSFQFQTTVEHSKKMPESRCSFAENQIEFSASTGEIITFISSKEAQNQKLKVIKTQSIATVQQPIVEKKRSSLIFKRKPYTLTPASTFPIHINETGTQSIFIVTKRHLVSYNISCDQVKQSLGQCITPITTFLKTHGTTVSGQIFMISKKHLTLRRALYFSVPENSHCTLNSSHFVTRDTDLFTITYKNVTANDIIQGIPKIEKLLEARSERYIGLPTIVTQIYSWYADSMDLSDKIRQSIVTLTFQSVQLYIINAVQLVYQSQGVNISDKHLEVIVKQMACKVVITDPGNTGILHDDAFSFNMIQKINDGLAPKEQAIYRPVIMGITKVSLQGDGFLSGASFQETVRVLTYASMYQSIDFLKGLKEHILFGYLLPIGTSTQQKIFEKYKSQSQYVYNFYDYHQSYVPFLFDLENYYLLYDNITI